MALLFFKQLSALLWKCWIMRKCHYISTVFEIIFPLFIIALIVGLRASGTKGHSADRSSGPSQPSKGKGWVGPVVYWKPVFNDTPDQLLDRQYNFYYTPPDANPIMAELKKILPTAGFVAFPNEAALLANMSGQDYYSNRAGLVFHNYKPDFNLNYKIRIRDYSLMRTVGLLYPTKFSSGPVADYDVSTVYWRSDFVYVQTAVNEAYLNYVANVNSRARPENTRVARVAGIKMPYPPYFDSDTNLAGSITWQTIVAMMLIYGYIAFVPLIVKRITDEKVAKAKEMLRMMGMSDWVFWGSHFINYFSVMLVHSALFTVMLFVGWGGIPSFVYSDGTLFFCVMILFSASTILFCMLITTVFNRPVIAVVVTVIIHAIEASVPQSFLSPIFKSDVNIEKTQSWRVLSCLLPNMGLNWALELMGQWETYAIGAKWSNLWTPVSNYGRFTLGYVMLMMFISCFVYGVLIWYMDNVWPFQYGIPKPVYYIFQPSYWLPNRSKQLYSAELDDDSAPVTTAAAKHFEAEPLSARIGISCRKLRKTFGKKTAVESVSLNIYSGQITVLLGHNGAGKTTTMNMITGIFPPSGGSAHIDGYDVRHQTREARRSMALCPQENILYNELNVYEHLKLYALLKDHPWHDVDNEIARMLTTVALTDKMWTPSPQLSGGMKRKLALAIAMIANSKILILDEPTSGMDPEARRHIWDVLASIRSERTILLTTHYMEEADILGDRIAIMSEGFVKCCGSPLFLKKIYGAGYHLRVAKGRKYAADDVLKLIRGYIPGAKVKGDINTEIIYSLDNDNSQSSIANSSALLVSLFEELEKGYNKFGIHSCGLTVTTMEDVFLRVGNDDDESAEVGARRSSPKGMHEFGSTELMMDSEIRKNYGSGLAWQQFYALLLKRFHYARRYWPMIVLQTVLPALLFMCILLIDQSLKSSITRGVPALDLRLNMYGSTKGFIKVNSNNKVNITDNYQKFALNERITTTRLDDSTVINNWCLDRPESADISQYIKTYLVGAEVNQTGDGLSLGVWFNNEALHTLPISLNILYQTLLQLLAPSNSAPVSLSVQNQPIPLDNGDPNLTAVLVGLIVSCLLLVPITVPFIGASYVLFPIHERTSSSKLLQLMTGLSSAVFWAASYVFDLLNHLLACVAIFVVIAIFDWNHVFIGQNGIRTGLFLMLFLFGFASIPLAYLISFRLKKPSSGYAFLVIVYLISGIVLMVPFGIFDIYINTFKDDTIMSADTLNTLLIIFRFLPVFSMCFGIQKLYKIGSYVVACDNIIPAVLNQSCSAPELARTNALWGCCAKLCRPTHECYDEVDPLRWGSNGVAIEFTFLVVSGVVYLAILVAVEMFIERLSYFASNFDLFCFNRSQALPTLPTPAPNQFVVNLTNGQQLVMRETMPDSDVADEKLRIEEMFNRQRVEEDAIVVRDLTKSFGRIIPISAVNRLTFGVHKEECFGLLGVNGAGKTTTFRMLTGDETVSSGNAWIQYFGLRSNLKQFQRQIGYCPQFDALLTKLTGRETIYLFCRLRGMPEASIRDYAGELIRMVDLEKHADKCTENYSGGNRRKLSLALALCAAPPVIFLDEPTSGVDPAARRKIWTTLVRIQEKYQSAIVLTSHSMEECEALCARIAIMVNGEFRCLGSVQHLRSKFGQGFTIMAKLKRELAEQTAYMNDIQAYIGRQFPSAVLKDIHECHLHYHITDTSVLWSQMFRSMEEIKVKFFLEDYLVSDTTLEQIFLAFARSQR